MALLPGTHTLGPNNAKLLVNTRRTGAAAKAGHDLEIEVTTWSATVEVGEGPSVTSMTLSADARSLRVREGSGGIQALGEDDMEGIEQTIDDEVLKGGAIEFRSTEMGGNLDGGRLQVRGELDLGGTERPIEFELALAQDNRLTGSAIVKQTDWGIKPYSTLFGVLKVADEVEVTIDGTLEA
jgi:polyisoprenoid-binding protein YceI